jgi:hypothetical protein
VEADFAQSIEQGQDGDFGITATRSGLTSANRRPGYCGPGQQIRITTVQVRPWQANVITAPSQSRLSLTNCCARIFAQDKEDASEAAYTGLAK